MIWYTETERDVFKIYHNDNWIGAMTYYNGNWQAIIEGFGLIGPFDTSAQIIELVVNKFKGENNV